MNLMIKRVYYFSFIVITFYTIYGILKMGETGGPCNAGIAIITYIPILLIVACMLLASFHIWLKGLSHRFGSCQLLSILGILCWTGGIMISIDSDGTRDMLYLCPLLVLSIATLMITFRKSQEISTEKQ
jgi:hypothetical protein